MGCWILSTPRTGSSYLAKLLNSAGLNPPFEEYYCGNWEPFDKMILNECPPFVKIHFSQFQSQLKTLPANTKFIRIRRRNFHETALSWCLVHEYQIWNTTDRFPSHEVEIKPTQILRHYYRSKLDYGVWDDVLKNTPRLEIYYEDFIQNPLGTTNLALEYMGINGQPDLNHSKIPIKIPYPNKEKHERKVAALLGVK